MSGLQNYYLLTKPGIIRGNALTAAAGFFLASKGDIDWLLLIATIAGISLIIGAAGVFNNYIDRSIDKKMARTKNRALVTKSISTRNALLYGSVLALLGTTSLLVFTNILTLSIALMGLFFYVVMYGIWKRRSVHGTLVGSISGAVPPVVGYCAVSNSFDLGALLLFVILVCWQMPHFYAIAIYRSKDYKAAGIPVLPVKKNVSAAKKQIIFYVFLFILASLLLTAYDYTGYVYTLAMGLLGGWWLHLGLKGLKTANAVKWAQKMFGVSLTVLSSFSALLILNAWLP